MAKILDFGVAKVLEVAENPVRQEQPAWGTRCEDAAGGSGQVNDPELREDGLRIPRLSRPKAVSARMAAAERAPLQSQTTLTRTGTEMGTAGYMSPEQVRGEKLDARTDIFSFGLVLYEMATGQRAFSGETAAVVRDGILNDSPVPVRELNSMLPARLVTTIDKCLEKEREQRYQSAAELRTALDIAKRGAENKVPRRVLGPWIAGVLVLVALAVVGFYMRRASYAPRLGSGSSSLQVRPLTDHGKSYRVAATPDGSYVAYVKKEADKYELRLLAGRHRARRAASSRSDSADPQPPLFSGWQLPLLPACTGSGEGSPHFRIISNRHSWRTSNHFGHRCPPPF